MSDNPEEIALGENGNIVWSSEDDSSGPVSPSAPMNSDLYVKAEWSTRLSVFAQRRIRELENKTPSMYIGSRVRVSRRYAYFTDWCGDDGESVLCTVVGLHLKDGGCDVTIKADGETTEYDGFALADLEVIQEEES